MLNSCSQTVGFMSRLRIKLWVAGSLFKKSNRVEDSRELSVISRNFCFSEKYVSVLDPSVRCVCAVDHCHKRVGD